jgi:hypothetical protein
MSATMDQLRTAKPRSNMFHNLVHSLAIKLDSAARYDIYINDANQENCQQCVQLWQKCKDLEMQQIQLIEDELGKHFKGGSFQK